MLGNMNKVNIMCNRYGSKLPFSSFIVSNYNCSKGLIAHVLRTPK